MSGPVGVRSKYVLRRQIDKCETSPAFLFTAVHTLLFWSPRWMLLCCRLFCSFPTFFCLLFRDLVYILALSMA